MVSFASSMVLLGGAAEEPQYDNAGGASLEGRVVNTNILSVDMNTIAEETAAIRGASPFFCECRAALSQMSAVSGGVWTCEFCGEVNKVKLSSAVKKAMARPVAVYLLAPAVKQRQHATTVYCVDISGSMGVTATLARRGKWTCQACTLENEEVMFCAACGQARHDVKYVSRLRSMQKAVQRQFDMIARNHPETRVALVAFNDEVQVFADGNGARVMSGDMLFDFDALVEQGKALSVGQSISTAKGYLARELESLEESGRTALGPALLVSVALAGTTPGSKVIVCTDGLSNVGLGALAPDSSELERQYSQAYYERVRSLAIDAGVAVSVISIQGEECNLSQLGQVAVATGGSVMRVTSTQLMERVSSASADTLASRVKVNLVLHTRMHAYQLGLPVPNPYGHCGYTEVVGACAPNTEVLFAFNRIPDECAARLPRAPHALAHRVPFQVQIQYTDNQGAEYIRVETVDQPVTDDPRRAEKECNIAMVSAYATQASAQLALQSSFGMSRLLGEAYRKLVACLERGSAEEQAVYDNFITVMDGLYEQLGGVSGDQLQDQAADALFNMRRASSRRFKRPSAGLYDRLNRSDSSTPGESDPDYHDADGFHYQQNSGYETADAVAANIPAGYEAPQRRGPEPLYATAEDIIK